MINISVACFFKAGEAPAPCDGEESLALVGVIIEIGLSLTEP
jgi:hypothetical protein